jgi:O-antigen/teichoic acid export membrane protein
MWRASRLGGLILLTSIPTLFFYRVEVAVAMALLGPASTGLFVYVRQIIGAVLQGAQLIRRAEFPMLMAALQGREFDFIAALKVQRTSLFFGGFAGVAIIAAASVAYPFVGPSLGAAASLAIAFVPALFAACLYSALIQIFVGLGRIGDTAVVSNFAVLCATAASIPLVLWVGLYAFALVEVAMNILAFLFLLALLRRRPRGGAPVAQGVPPSG